MTQQFQVGDLVEATKGTRAVRDVVTVAGGPFFPGQLTLGEPRITTLSTLSAYEQSGYTLKLVSRPIVLPTEAGTVIAIGEWWLVKLRSYEGIIDGAWELLPVPESVQPSIDAAGARTQCVYGNAWVQAEAEQEGSFRIISKPVAEVTE